MKLLHVGKPLNYNEIRKKLNDLQTSKENFWSLRNVNTNTKTIRQLRIQATSLSGISEIYKPIDLTVPKHLILFSKTLQRQCWACRKLFREKFGCKSRMFTIKPDYLSDLMHHCPNSKLSIALEEPPMICPVETEQDINKNMLFLIQISILFNAEENLVDGLARNRKPMHFDGSKLFFNILKNQVMGVL